MKTQTKVLYISLGAVFLLVFNVCFFIFTAQPELFPNGRIASVWINYGCVHAAYILFLLTPFLYPQNVKEDVALPMFKLTFGFWWFEVALSALLIYYTIPLAYNVIIQVVCFGIVATRLIIVSLVNINTAEKQRRHSQEIVYVKTAEALLKSKMMTIVDKDTLNQIEKVYDFIRTSPLKSTSEAKSIELEVLDLINSLVMVQEDVEIISLCKQILPLAQKRNQVLIINNKLL